MLKRLVREVRSQESEDKKVQISTMKFKIFYASFGLPASDFRLIIFNQQKLRGNF